MTPRPPARTPLKLFDARRATGTLLLLTGSLSLGLTTLWLDRSAHATQAQTAIQPDTTDTWASAPTQEDDWQDRDDDWTQAAPQGSFDSQPAQSARGWSRGS
ncbi:hypothetical protein [Deinococcus kurensis]|uniref:hypothetical protein n=1 Tax=Deinococcus kurensis TaxID=2662757 RepID=UPI0012D33EA8|nr:hypothetical protein [Deinococcus kurensis]